MNGNLQGRVLDSLGQPIASADVVITGVNVQGVLSDESGFRVFSRGQFVPTESGWYYAGNCMGVPPLPVPIQLNLAFLAKFTI